MTGLQRSIDPAALTSGWGGRSARSGQAARLAAAALLVGLVCGLAPARSARAAGPPDDDKKPVYKVVDWTENRFVQGDPRKFERPAQIVILDVMSQIPAYQQVIKEKLTEKDPRYYFLMQEATQQLVAAVEKVTRKSGHDLVADAGAVEVAGGGGGNEKPVIPDLTQAVIEALKK
jgi:hypothetical protein